MSEVKEKYRETIIVIMTGLLIFWLITDEKKLVIIAATIGFIGAFIPSVAQWVHRAWYKLAEALGYVSSRVLLTVVFFLFLFPIAIISKVFKKDNLRVNRKTETFWKERNHTYRSEDLKNIW